MMRIVLILSFVLFLSFLADQTTSQEQNQPEPREEPPESCPITKASTLPFLPPAPYPSDRENVWIGSNKLWTFVPSDGVWRHLPHYTPDDSRFRQKVFWWSEGYDFRIENPPKFTITGKRLDGPAPPLASDPHANNGWTSDSHHPFIVDGIFIPALGCWQITGHYKDEQLSYVVWVGRMPHV